MEAGEDHIAAPRAEPPADTDVSLLSEIARLRRLLCALEEHDLVENARDIATVSTALARLVYVQATRAQATGDIEHALQEAGRAELDAMRLAELD